MGIIEGSFIVCDRRIRHNGARSYGRRQETVSNRGLQATKRETKEILANPRLRGRTLSRRQRAPQRYGRRRVQTQHARLESERAQGADPEDRVGVPSRQYLLGAGGGALVFPEGAGPPNYHWRAGRAVIAGRRARRRLYVVQQLVPISCVPEIDDED